MESKYAKHSYKFVERNSDTLQLIYIGICGTNLIPSRGGKKYLINFIANCIRTNVYLLYGIDEAIETSRQYNIEVEYQ